VTLVAAPGHPETWAAVRDGNVTESPRTSCWSEGSEFLGGRWAVQSPPGQGVIPNRVSQRPPSSYPLRTLLNGTWPNAPVERRSARVISCGRSPQHHFLPTVALAVQAPPGADWATPEVYPATRSGQTAEEVPGGCTPPQHGAALSSPLELGSRDRIGVASLRRPIGRPPNGSTGLQRCR
jgi:hypothetical protein